jgi:hypothetical protein
MCATKHTRRPTCAMRLLVAVRLVVASLRWSSEQAMLGILPKRFLADEPRDR